TPDGTSAAQTGPRSKSQAVAFGRSTVHDGVVSIVISARLGQHLKSLAQLPIDSSAHFGAGRVIGANDQQAAERQRVENVSHRDRQLLRIKIGRIKNVHNPHDIHSTGQGVRLQEIVLQQTESTIACGKVSRCRAEQYQGNGSILPARYFASVRGSTITRANKKTA